MEALEKGDVDKAHTIKERLNSIQRKQTPGATPLKVGTTPLPSPYPASNTTYTAEKETTKDLTEGHTISSFLATYTSEDDQLFNDLHDKDVKDHHKKFFWIKEKELKMIQNGPEPVNLMIKNISENTTPEIHIENTRVRINKGNNTLSNSNSITSSNTPSSKSYNTNLKSQQYDLLSTPLNTEDNDGNTETIMTWGEIESTPLLLDNSLKDLCDIPASPYRLGEDKKSDKVRDKLIEKNRNEKKMKRKSGLPQSLLQMYERRKKIKALK